MNQSSDQVQVLCPKTPPLQGRRPRHLGLAIEAGTRQGDHGKNQRTPKRDTPRYDQRHQRHQRWPSERRKPPCAFLFGNRQDGLSQRERTLAIWVPDLLCQTVSVNPSKDVVYAVVRIIFMCVFPRKGRTMHAISEKMETGDAGWMALGISSPPSSPRHKQKTRKGRKGKKHQQRGKVKAD